MKKVYSVIRLLLLIFTVLCLTSCAKVFSNEEFDQMHGGPAQRYTASFLNGTKYGFDRHDRIVDGDEITNKSADLTSYGGGEQRLDFSSSVETADGVVLRFENDTVKGVRNNSGSFDIISVKSGKKLREMDWPKGALLGEGRKKLQMEKGLAEGTAYEMTLFSVKSLESRTVKIVVGGKKEVQLIDSKEVLTELFITEIFSPGNISYSQFVDDEFNVKKFVANFGVELMTIECNREFAVTENQSMLEIVGVVKSPRSLARYDRGYEIRYVLKPKIEGFGIVSTDNHVVVPGKNGTVIITSKPVEAVSGISFPYLGDNAEAIEGLKATDLLECDDEMIIELAKKAVGKTDDAAKAAKKIEAYVQSHLSKGDIKGVNGFPTALETAKVRRGDCKGHAALTAAMCRAVGIPARVMTGYVYTSYHGGHWRVFVAHAWTEAYIGDKWVGLDATKNTFWGLFKSYDATYIATGIKNSKAVDLNLGTFEIEKILVRRMK